MQAGHANGFAPLCIGSHYAVRTQALKEIGGLGPELAEDHSTSLLFNAHGWRGAFAFLAIAHGDGPACLSDFVTQEFQWSRSLVKLLFTFTPHHWRNIPGARKIQFLFAQFWYPLSCCYMLLGCLLPPIALVTGVPMVNVGYPEFLLHFWGITASCLLLVLWIERQGWLRPANAKILSWEGWLFPFVTWPWMLLGVTQALGSVLLRKELSFRVTPKGSGKATPLPGRVLLPYTVIALSMFAIASWFPGGQAHTYHFFSSILLMLYTVVLWAALLGHRLDNRQFSLSVVGATMKWAAWQPVLATILVAIDLYRYWPEVVAIFFTF
jgi:cellulose synthase (UDP-forming)